MVPLGIPYSEFLAWDEQDQDLALAWLQAKAIRCPSCGTVPDEWLDEDGKHLEPQPYIATAHRCLGCETLHEKHEEVKGPDGHTDRRYTIGLIKNRDKL